MKVKHISKNDFLANQQFIQGVFYSLFEVNWLKLDQFAAINL